MSLELKDLKKGMRPGGMYDHLRVIMSRRPDCSIDETFLFVSRKSLVLVNIIDIVQGEDEILLTLQELHTKLKIEFSLKLNAKEFKFLLLSWRDIAEMTKHSKESTNSDDTLLDFCF